MMFKLLSINILGDAIAYTTLGAAPYFLLCQRVYLLGLKLYFIFILYCLDFLEVLFP
jgi:hypothetical protein